MTEGVQGGNFARTVVEQVQQVARERGAKVAKQWGEPLDGQAPTRAQTVQLWNYQNPAVLTPEGQMAIQQMLAAGQHAQALDLAFPYRNRLIGRGDINKRIERANQLAEMAMRAEMMEAMGE